MKKRTANECIKSAKQKVARIVKAEKMTNDLRLGIARDCRDYCLAVADIPFKWDVMVKFAEVIRYNHYTLKDHMDQLKVTTALGDSNIPPKKARRILNRCQNRNDSHEIKAQGKLEEISDPITKKLYAAIEYVSTTENILKILACRKEDKENWMVLGRIAGKVRDIVYNKISALK